MNSRDEAVVRIIKETYSDIYHESNPHLPQAYYINLSSVKAIVIGCDPSNDKGNEFHTVFNLDPDGDERYFNSINMNLKYIDLCKSDIYVENLCKNYFNKVTAENKKWPEIAKLWVPVLKGQLDKLFDNNIPVLATSKYVLEGLNKEKCDKFKAYYDKSLFITKENSKLNRVVIPFFRHWYYSIERWSEYLINVKRIINRVDS